MNVAVTPNTGGQAASGLRSIPCDAVLVLYQAWIDRMFAQISCKCSNFSGVSA